MIKKFTKQSLNSKLDNRSLYLRSLILECFTSEKRGHIGPAMSIIEILRVIYDNYISKNKEKFKFILSKGHGCLALYSLLYDYGYIKKKDLREYGSLNGILGGHPESQKIKGVELSTGSLGHGFPMGVGMSLANKILKKKIFFFILCGDGEMNEGSIWEAMMSASKHKLSNLILLIDYNKLQSYDFIKNVLDLEPLDKKLKSFGFYAEHVNGHNIDQINKKLKKLIVLKNKPKALICHTVKGKGIKEAEFNPLWHHKSFISSSEMELMKKNFSKRK